MTDVGTVIARGAARRVWIHVGATHLPVEHMERVRTQTEPAAVGGAAEPDAT